MKTRISRGPFRIVMMFLCFLALSGFDSPRNGQVLEIPQGTSAPSSATPREPPTEYYDPSGSIPSGPDLRFHQFLKFYGCWTATVASKDLTTFTSGSSDVMTQWTNQRYTICFARDLSGELEPNISQIPVTDDKIESLASSTEVLGYDDQVVSLVNRYAFKYTRDPRNAPPVHWYTFRRAAKPVKVQQAMNVNCLR